MFKKNKQPPARNRPEPAQNSPVFSYYASRSRSDKNVGRLKEEVKRSLKWQFIPSFIALGAILLCFIYVTVLDTNPRVTVTGNANSPLLKSTETYRQEAEKQLKRSITSRGKLTIDTRKIENELKAVFPELADVAITIPVTGRRPIVDIAPVEPAIVLTGVHGAFVLDYQGLARAKITAQETLDGLKLPKIADDSQLELVLGKAALPADNVSFIVLLMKHFEQASTPVESAKLPTVANELHVRVTGQGYDIKFNLQGDARAQAGTYFAVRERLAVERIKPAEYIDVRVEEKAFYK